MVSSRWSRTRRRRRRKSKPKCLVVIRTAFVRVSLAELFVLGLLIMGATQPHRLRRRYRFASHTKLHLNGTAEQ